MSKYLNKALFMREDPMRGVSAPDGSTKARIERASLRLFAEHGIDGVSIKDIAKACKLSDGAMYRHFESKEALARQLFEAIHKSLMAVVKDSLEDGASLEDTVRAVTTAARCTTTSKGSSVSWGSAKHDRSPWRTRMPFSMRCSALAGVRTSPTTSWPSRSRRSTRCAPMKPVEPVMK